MSTTSHNVEEKIVNAAIECIEQYGVSGATSRKISAAAGVNVAAINYYFRSKDALVERVMETTLDNAFDFSDFDRLPGGSAVEHCTAVFREILAGGLRYPGISRAHFYSLFNAGQPNPRLVERINLFVARLADDLAARGAALASADLRLACVQILYAVLMAVLDPQVFHAALGMSLDDPESRNLFVSRLVERLLAGEVNHAAE